MTAEHRLRMQCLEQAVKSFPFDEIEIDADKVLKKAETYYRFVTEGGMSELVPFKIVKGASA